MTSRLSVNLRRELDRIRRKLFAPPGVAELPPEYPQDFSSYTSKLWQDCGPYTMTSKERMAVLEQAVRYVCGQRIAGAVVECGVALGGSAMALATVLRDLGESDRDLTLFDTFAGMPEPTDQDVSVLGKQAATQYARHQRKGNGGWHAFDRDTVAANMARTGYPAERLHFVAGKVEDTLPATAPGIGAIALLRLDTDWYESTRAEMEHLFPQLAVGGVLIIDDYGRWMGSRKAVDDYLANNNIRIFLARVDDHAVVGVKQHA